MTSEHTSVTPIEHIEVVMHDDAHLQELKVLYNTGLANNKDETDHNIWATLANKNGICNER